MNFRIYQNGDFTPVNLDDFLKENKARARRIAFADDAIDVIAKLSSLLLRSDIARENPQITALGYWLRKGAILPLLDNYKINSLHQARSSRGFALHLPPANVDTLFVYSWVLSFLSGNANLVRLPNQPNQVTSYLVEAINSLLPRDHDQFFCQYDSNSTANEDISRHCDLRIIWGGNEKVNLVSKFPVKPDGLSIGFPDRKSFCILSEQSFGQKSDEEKDQLVKRFFNDVFWFDQMGCGSPRLLIWTDATEDHTTIRRDFYSRLSSVIAEQNYKTNPSIALSKRSYADRQLAEKKSHAYQWFSNELAIIQSKMHPDMLDDTIGGGSIIETIAGDIADVASILNDSIQTITYDGISEEDKQRFLTASHNRGFYRLVPIGDALNFNPIWDGVDLIEHFTRRIWLN